MLLMVVTDMDIQVSMATHMDPEVDTTITEVITRMVGNMGTATQVSILANTATRWALRTPGSILLTAMDRQLGSMPRSRCMILSRRLT